MRLKSIAELKADGWRVEPSDEAAGFKFKLVSPEGKKVDVSISEEYAWALIPNLPGCIFLDKCDTTQQENVGVFDLIETEAIEKHVNKHGPWGWHFLVLSPSDLDALQSGKCIVWGQDEYTSLIYFDDREAEQ